MASSESSPFEISAQPADVAIPDLFHLHSAAVHSLGLRICGTPQEAEDLVQETFLEAFRKWDQFQGRSSPKTWLYSIATRACRRLHRKRAGEPTRMESLSQLLPSGQIPEVPSLGQRPDELASSGELRSAVETAISRLPLPFQLALVLKDLAEFSVREVAQVPISVELDEPGP